MWDYLVRDGLKFSKDFLINEKATPEEKKRILSFFSKLVKNQGKKRLVFKITGPSRLSYLLSIFPDASVVQINRDPIAVVNSLMRVPFWRTRGMNAFWWEGAYDDSDLEWLKSNASDSVQITAYQVKRVQDLTREEIDTLKPDTLQIEYSKFVKNPQATIEEILSFTGLEHDNACFDYFKKNKIYNQNKKNETYFSQEERQKLVDFFQ